MTYEYVCTACSHGWEAEQRISAAPLTACPSCQQETAKRQVSGGAGFILKGSGWYADLYSSPKPGKENASEAKDGAKPDAKVESKSDTKESKSDTKESKSDTKESKNETKKESGVSSGSSSTASKPGDSSGSSGDSSSGTTSSPTPTKPANAAAS